MATAFLACGAFLLCIANIAFYNSTPSLPDAFAVSTSRSWEVCIATSTLIIDCPLMRCEEVDLFRTQRFNSSWKTLSDWCYIWAGMLLCQQTNMRQLCLWASYRGMDGNEHIIMLQLWKTRHSTGRAGASGFAVRWGFDNCSSAGTVRLQVVS